MDALADEVISLLDDDVRADLVGGGRVGGAVVTTKESEPAPSLVNAA